MHCYLCTVWNSMQLYTQSTVQLALVSQQRNRLCGNISNWGLFCNLSIHPPACRFTYFPFGKPLRDNSAFFCSCCWVRTLIMTLGLAILPILAYYQWDKDKHDANRAVKASVHWDLSFGTHDLGIFPLWSQPPWYKSNTAPFRCQIPVQFHLSSQLPGSTSFPPALIMIPYV